MEFIISNKGEAKIAFAGCIYIKQKELANEVVSYERELRRSTSQCKAKIKVKDSEIVSKMNEHTHGPDYHPDRKSEGTPSNENKSKSYTSDPSTNNIGGR